MCHTVPHDGMPCHLGAWDMATYSGQHDTMACSKLSKTLGFIHKTVVWGAQVDKTQKTEFAKQKNMRAGATPWLAAVNLNFGRMTSQGMGHTLAGCCQLDFGRMTSQGMDYIGQSKLPN